MKPAKSLPVLPPLRDAAGAELMAGLAELTAQGPDAAELASLATRLSLLGLPMTLPAPSAAAPTPSSGWKWGLAAGAAASGVALWLALRSAPPLAPTSTRAPASAANIARPSERAPSPRAASSSRDGSITPQGGSATLTEPAPLAPQPAAQAPASVPQADARLDGALARPDTVEPEPTLEPTANTSPSPRPKPGSKVPQLVDTQGATSADGSQPSELEILRGARLVLQSSPSEALRLTTQHQTSYPSGKLTQERELIAISALVALGRRTAALTRASSFERNFPNSAYRKQVSELLQ